MICNRCGAKCIDEISEAQWAEIECPICDGVGCEHCEEGHFRLTECARKYTRELVGPINMVAHTEKGLLPCAGGLLDQSAWFLALMVAVANEQHAIDAERLRGL